MTDQERDRLIAKMIASPQELTDAEIAQIAADEELRDIYTLACEVREAKAPASEVDAAEEWRRFRPRVMQAARRSTAASREQKVQESPLTPESQPPKRLRLSLGARTWWARAAAVLIGALLFTGVLYDRQTESPALAEAEILDIEEYLRVLQARMDNEMAMQTAAEIAARYATATPSDDANPPTMAAHLIDDENTLNLANLMML